MRLALATAILLLLAGCVNLDLPEVQRGFGGDQREVLHVTGGADCTQVVARAPANESRLPQASLVNHTPIRDDRGHPVLLVIFSDCQSGGNTDEPSDGGAFLLVAAAVEATSGTPGPHGVLLAARGSQGLLDEALSHMGGGLAQGGEVDVDLRPYRSISSRVQATLEGPDDRLVLTGTVVTVATEAEPTIQLFQPEDPKAALMRLTLRTTALGGLSGDLEGDQGPLGGLLLDRSVHVSGRAGEGTITVEVLGAS